MDAATGGTRVVGYEHIRQGGNALRHALGVLLLAWRHVVRAAGVGMLVGIVITEIVGVLATHHFPPYLLTHVVALVVGIALAYCVGLTVLVDELIKGTLALVRMALGEAEAAARTAAIIAEREVGDVWGWARRLVVGRDATAARTLLPDAARPRLAAPNGRTGRPGQGVASSQRPYARMFGQFPEGAGGAAGGAGAAEAVGTLGPRPAGLASGASDPARLRVPPRLGAAAAPSSASRRDETQEDIAATEVFRRTAPPGRADAHPVRADRLPRIEWAAEGLAAGAALLQSALAGRAHHAGQATGADGRRAPTPAEASLDAMPPLPPRVPATATPALSATPATPAIPATEVQSVDVRSAPPTVPLAPTPAVASAPPTIPLEPVVAPRPSPRPSPPVRTIPVITDNAALNATDVAATPAAPAADERSGGQEAGRDVALPSRAEAATQSDDGRADASVEGSRVEPRPAPAPASEIDLGATAETNADAHWEPPLRTIVLPPSAEGGATGKAKALAGMAPGDDEPRSADAGGLWSRIGQALARSTTRPLRERGDVGVEGDGAGDQRGP